MRVVAALALSFFRTRFCSQLMSKVVKITTKICMTHESAPKMPMPARRLPMMWAATAMPTIQTKAFRARSAAANKESSQKVGVAAALALSLLRTRFCSQRMSKMPRTTATICGIHASAPRRSMLNSRWRAAPKGLCSTLAPSFIYAKGGIVA